MDGPFKNPRHFFYHKNKDVTNGTYKVFKTLGCGENK